MASSVSIKCFAFAIAILALVASCANPDSTTVPSGENVESASPEEAIERESARAERLKRVNRWLWIALGVTVVLYAVAYYVVNDIVDEILNDLLNPGDGSG